LEFWLCDAEKARQDSEAEGRVSYKQWEKERKRQYRAQKRAVQDSKPTPHHTPVGIRDNVAQPRPEYGDRTRQVMNLHQAGKSQRAIAEELDISRRSVRTVINRQKRAAAKEAGLLLGVESSAKHKATGAEYEEQWTDEELYERHLSFGSTYLKMEPEDEGRFGDMSFSEWLRWFESLPGEEVDDYLYHMDSKEAEQEYEERRSRWEAYWAYHGRHEDSFAMRFVTREDPLDDQQFLESIRSCNDVTLQEVSQAKLGVRELLSVPRQLPKKPTAMGPLPEVAAPFPLRPARRFVFVEYREEVPTESLAG
jgi:Homeodomain-like domain